MAASTKNAAQISCNFEVVVADGVSGDRTANVVERFRERLPALCVDTLQDGGGFEPINRGISLATGRWIDVLGANDRLADVTVFERLSDTCFHTRRDIHLGAVLMSGI